MNEPEWTPPPWRDRLILGVFVAIVVLTLVGLALFVRIPPS